MTRSTSQPCSPAGRRRPRQPLAAGLLAGIGLILLAPATCRAAPACPGYTFFASGSKAYLLDMNSKTAHTWQASGSAQTCAYLLTDGSALFPIQSSSCTAPAHNGAYPSGRFQKISWDGAVTWDYTLCDSTARCGYDVEPMPNGNILVPADASNVSKIFEVQPTGTNSGTVVWTYTLPTNLTGSTTYLNSVSYNPDLDQILVDLQEPQRKLVVINHSGTGSVAYTYTVASTGRVHAAAWVTKYFIGSTAVPTNADFTAMRTNNLLVVYNDGKKAMEVSLVSNSLVRSYTYAFDSHEGSVQRLPNGNTLVTPGNARTITEIDDSGATVATMTAPGSIDRAYRYGYDYPGVSRLLTNAATGSGTAAFSNAAACSPVAVTYTCSNGVLQGATQMFAHLGYNGWTQVFPTQKMTKVATNQWRLTTTPPQDVSQLNVVFHNGAGTWDLNGGTNWNFTLNVCSSTLAAAAIAITNPAGGTTVAATTTACTVQGTASNVTGFLAWSNALNGSNGTLAAASPWSLAAVPLATGTNGITVSGTNAAATVTNATDSGANFVYNDGWTANDNGGFGFGAWQAATSSTNAGVNGRFMATGSVVGIGTPAWGLYANSTNLSEVKRMLSTALATGQTFSVRFDNGYISSGAGVGVALQNSGGDTLWQFYFNGGDTNYNLTGSQTDIGWTTNGIDIALTLSGPTSFVARITPVGGTTRTNTGDFAAATNMSATVFRAWNWNAGTGSDYDFYFNSLQVVSARAGAATSATVSVIRPAAIAASNTLMVISPYGSPSPSGAVAYASGTIVTACVSQVQTTANVVQYTNTGWVLSGLAATNGAPSGTGTSVVLALTTNATLTWTWTTNYWLAAAANGGGTLVFSSGAPGWLAATGSAVMVAVAATNWNFSGWSGDTNGCAITGNQLTAPMMQARALTAGFAPYTGTSAVARLDLDWSSGTLAASNLPAGVTALLMRATSLLDGDWQATTSFLVTGTSTSWPAAGDSTTNFFRLQLP